MKALAPRLLLVVSSILVGSIGADAAAAQSMALDHRELAADEQVNHVLSRLTFGARPGDAQRVRSMGVDKWIEQQLQPGKIDDSHLERFMSGYASLHEDQNELLLEFTGARRERRAAQRRDTARERGNRMAREAMGDGVVTRRNVVTQLQSARVARAVATNRQLEEVVTDFWLNHFNVFAQKGPPQPFYIAEFEAAVRKHSMGKFRDLLGAVAKSPAMLFYLDNARSMGDTSKPRLATINRRRASRLPDGMRQQVARLREGGLNENYGRELLELHTLGVDGGYTQQDVIELARVLTGWTIRQPAAGGGFVFRPEMHDAAEKQLLGHRFPAGGGIEEGEKALDMLAKHPSTARHIARKLATRFTSDDPSDALVDRAAAVYLRTDGDIREVLRSILTSNEFFSRASYRSKVKSPFEVVVSAVRAMNAPPDQTPRTAQAIAFLGQPIYGHQAPNGYPETGEAWMNTGAILNRINFGIAAAGNRLPGVRIDAIPGADSLRIAPREKQVDAVARLLLGGVVSSETRSVLISGENPLMRSDETTPRLTGLAQVVGLAIGSPEFQRR
jgi:uncharacterized protein (DUF1800 family)